MDGHLFDVQPFGRISGLPVGLKIGAELVELGGILEGQDGAGGAHTVTEGIEADGFFAFRSFGTGGMLRIPPIRFKLFG